MPHFDKPNFVMQDNPEFSAYGMMVAVSPFWLNEGDVGYEDYFQELHDFGDGYKGKMNGRIPEDNKDFDVWFSSLSIKRVQKCLCVYSFFPPLTINEEGVLWCFQWALDDVYRQHCANYNLPKEERIKLVDVNLPVIKTSAYKQAYEAKAVELNNATYAKIPNAELYKVVK